jgi:hypothetical protein
VNQHKQSSDLHIGRGWLNRAAEMLDACEDHVSDAEFATAAAAVGNGFVQLAAVERTTAWRAEDLARFAADREAERENDEVVREANLLALARERREVARFEDRARDVGIDVAAFQRAVQAQAEARPHDDEPKHAHGFGVVWVVADGDGPIHAAATQALAQTWATDAESDYEGLSVTAVTVDHG